MAEPAWTMFEIAAGTGMLGHGLSIALETLGIRTDVVGGCEWESCAASAFLAGVEIETGRRPAVWDDARTFAPRRWRSRTGSVVDIIAAGYPCQPFSSAGRRAGGKDARHLWPACRRIIARLQPAIVFLENVDGHLSMGVWKVIRDCERLGYRTTAGVYSSEEVGAPHLRKRLFVLGLRECDGREPTGISDERKESVRVPAGARAIVGDTKGVCVREQDHAERTQSRQRSWDDDGGASGGMGATDGAELWCNRTGINGVGRPIFPPSRGVDPGWLAARLAKADGEAACREAVLDAAGVSERVFGDWAAVAASMGPAYMPSIESGVSVVADGLASSSDLLRLGGNGVNPLCAAWAFLNLCACLMDDVEGSDSPGPLFNGAGGGRRNNDRQSS